jgi:hypothetical protein
LRQLWDASRVIANSLLVVMVLFGGFTVMSYGSLQSRWPAAEIVPRLFIAAVALNLSWLIITTAVQACVALAVSLAGEGMTPAQVLGGLLVRTANSGGLFLALLSVVALFAAVVLALSLIVTTVVLCLLIVAAPLALLAHAMPQTEGIAFAWWRAFTATCTVPLIHGLLLALAARVLFTGQDTPRPGSAIAAGPAGGLLGTTSPGGGLLELAVLLALLWVMVKVPFWAWSTVKTANPLSSGKGSLLGRLAKTALAVGVVAGTAGAGAASLGAAGAPGATSAAGGTGGGLGAVLGGMARSRGTTGLLGRAGLAAYRRMRPAPAPTSTPTRAQKRATARWAGITDRLGQRAFVARPRPAGTRSTRPDAQVRFQPPETPDNPPTETGGQTRPKVPDVPRGTVLPRFRTANPPTQTPADTSAGSGRAAGSTRAPVFRVPGGAPRVPTQTPRRARPPAPATPAPTTSAPAAGTGAAGTALTFSAAPTARPVARPAARPTAPVARPVVFRVPAPPGSRPARPPVAPRPAGAPPAPTPTAAPTVPPPHAPGRAERGDPAPGGTQDKGGDRR